MTKPIEAIYVAFGARLRLMREALGLSQDDVAKRFGWKRATVANIETGRQRVLLDGVERIASGLGTSPKALLKGLWW